MDILNISEQNYKIFRNRLAKFHGMGYNICEEQSGGILL